MSRNKRTTHLIDSHFLLHILLTAYRVLHSQLLRHLFLLYIYITHCIPCSQLLRQLPLLYILSLCTTYPATKTTCILVYITHCVPCRHPFTVKTQCGRVFCSFFNTPNQQMCTFCSPKLFPSTDLILVRLMNL